MGQIIYEEMGLEEVLARCKIVLIAKLIEANGKMRVRQVEGAPDAPFEYQCATWQIVEILYYEPERPGGANDSQPIPIEVGKQILVTEANVGSYYNLHVGYHVNGISRSVGYSRYQSSVAELQQGESYILMLQQCRFDPEMLEMHIFGSYESLDKLEEVKAIVSKKPPPPALICPPSPATLEPQAQALPQAPARGADHKKASAKESCSVS